MKASVKTVKRAKAFNKMNNQIGILSRTVAVKDRKLVVQLQEIASQLSIA